MYLTAGTASQAEAGTALQAADIVLLEVDTDLLEAGMAAEEAHREPALGLACSSAAVVHSWHLSVVSPVACTACVPLQVTPAIGRRHLISSRWLRGLEHVSSHISSGSPQGQVYEEQLKGIISA